jgi:hypothetical protein
MRNGVRRKLKIIVVAKRLFRLEKCLYALNYYLSI